MRAEQLGREEREGEVARVGHHPHVERLGHAPRDGVGAAERLDDRVDHEAGRRGVGEREGEVESVVGREVVVDQHAPRRGVGLDRLAEDLEPRHGVEVEAEDCVGLFDGPHGTALGVGLEDDDFVDTLHPVEEVGVFVRHDAGHRVAHAAQNLGPGERRSHGVAVGIGVRHDDEPLGGSCQQVAQLLDVCLGNLHFGGRFVGQRYKIIGKCQRQGFQTAQGRPSDALACVIRPSLPEAARRASR